MINKSLALIGFQACGKTMLGKLLAQELRCPFVDTDQLITQFHPTLSCRSIFQTFGSIYFRSLESQVIASLTHQPPIILATGGGSLTQFSNAEYLKANTTLIYLKTSAEILKKRIEQKEVQPAYLCYQTFGVVYEERSTIYEKWADHVIEMDRLSIEEALEQLKMIIQNFKA